MRKQGVNTIFFVAVAAVFIAISALLLASTASALSALPISDLPPCSNGVQDVNETGIDCGGSCVLAYVADYCDGKDNDKDCAVDEDCKNYPRAIAQPWSSPPANSTPKAPPTQAPKTETKQPPASDTTSKAQRQVSQSAVRSIIPPQQGIINESTTAEADNSQQSNVIVDGIIYGTSSPTRENDPNPIDVKAEPVDERQPGVSEAVLTDVSEIQRQESFFGGILSFFGFKKTEAEESVGAVTPENTVKEPAVNGKEPLSEAKQPVSESLTGMPAPATEAVKEAATLPAKSTEKQSVMASIMAKVLSWFK